MGELSPCGGKALRSEVASPPAPPRAATPWSWVEGEEKRREPSSAAATPSCARLMGEGKRDERGTDGVVRGGGREARTLPGSRRLSQLGPQPNPTRMQRGHMTSGGRATPFPLQGDPAPSCTDAVTKAGTSCSSLALSPLLSSQPRRCLVRRSRGLVPLSFPPALRGSPARQVLPHAGIMAPVFSLCTSLPRQLPNPAQLRLPLLQDDVSASQSGRAGLARAAWRLAAAQVPPHS